MPASRALAAAAAGAYLANVALGTAVRARLVDTSRNRAPHHVLYVVTTILTVVAIIGAFAQRSARGWLLVPSLLPLALLPRVGPDVHAITGAAAAPWYLAALLPSSTDEARED